MIDRTSDIPRKLWDLSHSTCVIIFGPNFPWLSEATIRLWATSGHDRFVVVCHEPKNALFSWDRLREIVGQLNVKGYQSSADEVESANFWRDFFNSQLRPLIEQKAAISKKDAALQQRTLSRPEITDVLASDQGAMDLLPGFPHICRKAIQAIDEDKSHTVVARIIEPDGALQASIIRTSNLARYGTLERIETLPTALARLWVRISRRSKPVFSVTKRGRTT